MGGLSLAPRVWCSPTCRLRYRFGPPHREWRFLSAPQRHRFFAKHYPVVAGLTPLNVSSLWALPREGEAVLDYVRGVATGPLAPMILALTNAGGALAVGIAFRTTVYNRETVAALVVAMQDCIKGLEL